jgi:hypothetical protein
MCESFAVVAVVDWLLSRHESPLVYTESKDTAIEELILPLACVIELRLLRRHVCCNLCIYRKEQPSTKSKSSMPTFYRGVLELEA